MDSYKKQEIEDTFYTYLVVGFVLAGLSFLLGAWYLLQKLFGIALTPGLSTTVLLVSFFDYGDDPYGTGFFNGRHAGHPCSLAYQIVAHDSLPDASAVVGADIREAWN